MTYINVADLEEIRRQWQASGSPRCEHPRFARERIERGARTGEFGCLDCGTHWWASHPTPPASGGAPLADDSVPA